MAVTRKNQQPLTWVTDHLAVGPAPMSHAALDSLREQGIGAILNLCGEFTDLHDIEAQNGFEVYHLPIPDEEAPDLPALEKALAWLDEAVYLGKKVLIHCRHGIGRTGTVLNAYLLRRGLGHLLAWKKLRKLRSKPTNFKQWRTVRRYGSGAVRLKVRQPTLEHRFQVDLRPFFADYEELVHQAEAALGPEQNGGARCGRGHDRCCHEPMRLTLVEAVHVNAQLGATLDQAGRAAATSRAAANGLEGAACPLLVNGACQGYESRPLCCRTSDLAPEQAARLWQETLTPALDKISREVFFTLTGQFMPDGFPLFSMADVVSGRYVQRFFDWLCTSNKAC
ncbi:MAG: phosphatase [Deltaproteobacteria bacterium HGW-Deltaproteobacteria-8]|jgi:protein-tyrosine phosphatase|nr:MAG: phosphatase [Deltaproteobacteria bacterium HGW-Deltaproteobacteria-8]